MRTTAKAAKPRPYMVPRLRLVMVHESPWTEVGRCLSSADTARMFRPLFEGLDREEFWIVPLDGKNRPIGTHRVSTGSLNASFVHPREFLKPLIMLNASAVILLHNHPSGDAEPSADDIAITKRLREIGTLVGISVLDHIVVGDPGYVSFADRGI